MSGYHPQPHYDDGLEVAPSSAPEYSSGYDDYELGQKIVVPPESTGQYNGQYQKYDDTPISVGAGAASHANGTITSRPWYKRKRILGIIVAAVVVLAIALGAGLGVGLNTGGDSSNKSDSDDSSIDSGKDKESVCKGGFCSRLLSISLYEDEMYVFGRSADKKTINFIKYDGSEWNDWEDLGTTSSDELVGPPSAQAWVVNATYWRLDVFAVGDRGNTVYNNWLSQEEDWPRWQEVGENIDGAITSCAVHTSDAADRLALWGIDGSSGNITKNWWVQKDDEDIPEEGFDGVTAENGGYYLTEEWRSDDPLGQANSPVAVVCAFSEEADQRYHDMMWYDPSGKKALHSYYADDDWSKKVDFPGDWIGDPALFTINDQRTDGYFFGVQEDHEMWHLSWDEGGHFSDLESLGGKVISAPTLQNDGEEVMNIVALGENGTLVHLHKSDRFGWNTEWEDLGIKASSAPLMRVFEDVLWIFALNENQELMAWSMGDLDADSWREELDSGRNLEGALSLEY